VFGGTAAWVSDIDPGASQILKHRMPDVPNIGDLTTTDWAAVEPVDIVCGGYPCQPFSTAGKRKGTSDERHIWPYIADALGVLRPRVAVFENVSGHLRLGFDTVLADLARLGFDVEWACARASEVGAPHQRNRLFILATATDAPDFGHERAGGTRRRRPGSADNRDAPSHTSGQGLEVRRVEPAGAECPAAERGRREPAADADRRRLAGHPECDGGTEDEQPGCAPGLDADRHHLQRPDWGRFDAAIRRWEAATGRTAPRATDDRNRLSPAFVEWLMGLEASWVTDVPGLSRTQQLHALGNGVVPQQAEAAIRLLAARAASHTATAA
jgi:DNA (cytosine-5)-methyltransferase 1